MTHLEIIRNEMWKQKYSIKKMAGHLGISPKTLSNGFSLKTDIGHSSVQNMANELGLRLVKTH